MTRQMLHATAVAIDGNGVLLIGPSGSGKSDLALRLIDRGAVLISDDAAELSVEGNQPMLAAAPNIAGKMEIRGVGICLVKSTNFAPLRMVAELANSADRLPDDNLTTGLAGFDVPLLTLVPFEVSAAIKLEYALRCVVDAGRWPVATIMPDKAESIKN